LAKAGSILVPKLCFRLLRVPNAPIPVLKKSARKRWVRRFLFMKSSTKDKIKGTLREAKGKVKEESGKAVGNPNLRDRGTDEKVAGKIQKKIGDVKKVFGK
jgi:uncharacterized protein YjbJ (UPF0337 family)